MGLLDAILAQAGAADSRRPAGAQAGGLGAIADLVMRNPQIVAAVLSMLNPKDRSVGGGFGLDDLASAFNRGGLGDVMGSWVSGGPNKPVDPASLESILGPDLLSQFARKAGIGTTEASSVLAGILPEVVNQMTPQGNVPQADALDSVLGSLLGQLGSR